MAHPFSAMAAAAISPSRLGVRLSGLAEFGVRDDGGVDRLALSQEELAARRWLVEPFLKRPGYQIAMDVAGNLFVRRNGKLPNADPFLFGSHIDTQPAGGRFDGAFGVCASLEVLDALDDIQMETSCPLEVVVWNNEEGVRFSPGLTGSRLFAAPELVSELDKSSDSSGLTMREACEKARSDFADFVSIRGGTVAEKSLGSPVRAYLEAHIEQGPLLEHLGLHVGRVTAIQAVRWFAITVPGRSAHAGTTPMTARDDAMAKAIELAGRILAAAKVASPDLRLTIGRWVSCPNSINTIANKVEFSLDIRHPDPKAIDEIEQLISSLIPRYGAAIETIFRRNTTHFASSLLHSIKSSCCALGISTADVLSGAFHDALNLADICPTAMLFTPSRKGISHHPDEYTDIESLVECTRVLAHVIVDSASLSVCDSALMDA